MIGKRSSYRHQLRLERACAIARTDKWTLPPSVSTAFERMPVAAAVAAKIPIQVLHRIGLGGGPATDNSGTVSSAADDISHA
jgi:hypothetical protein